MNGCGRTESAAYRTATTQRPSSFRTSTISSPKTKIRPVSYTHLDVYKRQTLEGGFFLSSKVSFEVFFPVSGSMTVCPTFFFGILACALSALAAAFSALQIGFSSAGSDRSSSVKRRRGSLFKPFSQHEGGHHVVQLCINGQMCIRDSR